MDTEVLNDLKELNEAKEELIAFIDEMKEWETLSSNCLFKKLILTDYCEQEPLRLVSLISITDEDRKDKVFTALEGISQFKSFLNMKKQSILVARRKLEDTEIGIKELEEALNESTGA